ncbi:hypothetical protein DL93DRAFT_1442541 [Clavulina sp. PMI_390]|nr:hypothetical protein DL93DRAFT_1442541 [Clavulina sp. PMI_390]
MDCSRFTKHASFYSPLHSLIQHSHLRRCRSSSGGTSEATWTVDSQPEPEISLFTLACERNPLLRHYSIAMVQFILPCGSRLPSGLIVFHHPRFRLSPFPLTSHQSSLLFDHPVLSSDIPTLVLACIVSCFASTANSAIPMYDVLCRVPPFIASLLSPSQATGNFSVVGIISLCQPFSFIVSVDIPCRTFRVGCKRCILGYIRVGMICNKSDPEMRTRYQAVGLLIGEVT